MDSILNGVKKTCNVSTDDSSFDGELIIFTNTILAAVTQMGVGPEEGITIEGSDDEWTDYISDPKVLSIVPTYVGLRVRILFDPPANSTLSEAINNQIKESEWRLYTHTDVPL